jgi:hypothetical protein
MIEFTPQAQSRLEQYLGEIRRVLAGSTSVSAREVEQDVRDHLDAALSGQPGPVGEDRLDSELNKLGAPSQWAADTETPWYRKAPAVWLNDFKQAAIETGQKLSGGPESYRLGYLSLLVLGLGLFGAAVVGDEEGVLAALVTCVVAFILSRAALSLMPGDRITRGQKWLLYPALLIFYVPLAIGTLVAPPTVAGVAIYEQAFFVRQIEVQRNEAQLKLIDTAIAHLHAVGKPTDAEIQRREGLLTALDAAREPVRFRGMPVTPAVAFTGTFVIGAAWLLCLGLLTMLFPSIVRAVFHPFADGFTRRHAIALAVIGGIGMLGSLALIG